LVYLAQLPLFVAGLWLGIGAAMAAGLIAATTIAAVGGWLAATLFAGLYAAPAVVLVRQALLARRGPDGNAEWYPSGLLAACLTALGIATLAGVVVFLGGPSGLEAMLHQTLVPAVDRLIDERSTSQRWISVLTLVAPGAIAASWMVMTASSAMLAQGVLARFGVAWRPSPDLAALQLPSWVSALLAVAAGAAAIGGAVRFYGISVLIVLSVPFCLAGLAVLHTVVRRLPRPHVPLVAFYVLAALFGWPLLAITVLGVLEAPLGLKRRLAPPGSIGEGER
jgi:hypothetical protein